MSIWRSRAPPRRLISLFKAGLFLGGSAAKESACNVGDLGLIPGLGRSPGEGKGHPLQYSGLGNSMDCIVRGVAKSQAQLGDFHFTFYYMVHYNLISPRNNGEGGG